MTIDPETLRELAPAAFDEGYRQGKEAGALREARLRIQQEERIRMEVNRRYKRETKRTLRLRWYDHALAAAVFCFLAWAVIR